MKFRKASSLFLAGAMCLSTFGGAMSVFADEETSSEAAEEETVDYSAEDPITATITVWGPAEDQAEEYGEWLQKRCEAFNELHVNWDLTFEYGTCSEGDAGKTISQDPSGSADVYMFANDQIADLVDAGALTKLGGDVAEYVKSSNPEAMAATVTYNGDIFPFMRTYIENLTERSYQNRTIGLIENGSWAPAAARIMQGMFEKSKNITWLENNVKITSSLSEANEAEIEAMAEELCK